MQGQQEKLISEANEYAANQKFPGHDWNKPL